MIHENPFIFLIGPLFNIYIAILLLRFLLQYVGADFYNPISQFIVKATQKPVFIARRIIPGFRGIDLASLALVMTLTIIKLTVIELIRGYQPPIMNILLGSLEDLIELFFNVFIFAIFIQAILSWVNPDPYNPVSGLLRSLTSPILKPIGKLLPPMGGLDLSHIVALIGLMFFKGLFFYIFQML